MWSPGLRTAPHGRISRRSTAPRCAGCPYPNHSCRVPFDFPGASRRQPMPEFPTITHVALTVTDLSRSVPWYEALFDAKPVLDEDTGPFRHVVWLVGGQTLVGLHQFPDLASGEPFNERSVGLDHLA